MVCADRARRFGNDKRRGGFDERTVCCISFRKAFVRRFLDSTGQINNGPELARRVQRDGYLFLRGLLPGEVLEELRLEWLSILRDAGWIQTRTPLEDAVAALDKFCVEPQSDYMEVYHRLYRLPEFHELQHHLHLVGLFERMWNEPVLPHPRLIGRVIFPQREAFTTPAHQDYIPIQGTPETYTVWFPLSDVSGEMGGLQVAAGSHGHGVYDFRPTLGAGGIEVTDPLDGTWLSNPFQQGDVLVFHSMTVHKGLPNTSDNLRLSIDARYQRVSDPTAPDSLEPHGKLITWEEIYGDWPNHERKYYWRDREMTLQPYNNSYYEKRDEMAFQMAAIGDDRAVSTLQRIISRDTDPAKKARAARLLEQLTTP